jgi:large subunit ribosomal protein L18
MAKATKQERRKRRTARVRARISGTAERPRLAVFRSLSHIHAQLIDDASGRTLVAAYDRELSAKNVKGKKKAEIADLVGRLLAEKAHGKGIALAVFDRRAARYHGRVRALAEGARAGGLKF